jgi:hypothetical protein
MKRWLSDWRLGKALLGIHLYASALDKAAKKFGVSAEYDEAVKPSLASHGKGKASGDEQTRDAP